MPEGLAARVRVSSSSRHARKYTVRNVPPHFGSKSLAPQQKAVRLAPRIHGTQHASAKASLNRFGVVFERYIGAASFGVSRYAPYTFTGHGEILVTSMCLRSQSIYRPQFVLSPNEAMKKTALAGASMVKA